MQIITFLTTYLFINAIGLELSLGNWICGGNHEKKLSNESSTKRQRDFFKNRTVSVLNGNVTTRRMEIQSVSILLYFDNCYVGLFDIDVHGMDSRQHILG